MRYFLFEKIKADDKLALLFNAYAEGLFPIEQLAIPENTVEVGPGIPLKMGHLWISG